MGVEGGKDFVEYIRGEIEGTKLVILLLTENYFVSQFCLCELGGAWVLNSNIIPIIVPPLTHRDMQAILRNIHSYIITEQNNLDEMHDKIEKDLKMSANSTATWNVQRDVFMSGLKECLSALPKPDIIKKSKHDALEEKYKTSLEKLANNGTKIQELEEMIEKIRQAKDAKEVDTIILESQDEIDQFDQLIKSAKKKLNKLPCIVKEAIFKWFIDDCLVWPTLGEGYEREEIKEAIENYYLKDHEEEGIVINKNDPQISTAINSLNELDTFISNINESEEFTEYYVDKFNHQLIFKSKRFWKKHLL